MTDKFEDYYGDIEKVRIHDDGDPIIRRPAEVEAARAIVNPVLPRPYSDDELEADMKTRGFVRCMGRCKGAFRHKDEFREEEKNSHRLGCYSYCRECEATMRQRKRAVLHPAQAAVRYEYQARKQKRKKRKG